MQRLRLRCAAGAQHAPSTRSARLPSLGLRWASSQAQAECEISSGPTEQLSATTVAHAAEVFRKHGMCFFASARSTDWVADAHEQAKQRWETNLSRLPGGDMSVGMEHGYTGLVHRARGCDCDSSVW